MKYIAFIFAASLASAATADQLTPWQEQAVVLALEEPKVLDATWSQSISFWISVADDGSPRDAYASYICLLLNQAGKPQGELVSVTAWDAATAASNNPHQLGKANCN